MYRFLLNKTKFVSTLTLVIVLSGVFAFTTYVVASNISQFNLTINAGTLATDIKDASRVTVGSPTVALSAATVSFSCLSGGSAPSGTFGTNTERVYVENPDAADNGWTLTVAPSATTATWSDGGTNTFDFNDAGGSGCTDGADTDSVGGQMTIDAVTSGTITADYTVGPDTTGLTLGSSASFVEGSTDSLTLITAASGSDDVGRWYLTGVDVVQTIPADQPAASYSLNMTLTVTAS